MNELVGAVPNLINEMDKVISSDTPHKRTGHYPSDVLNCSRAIIYSWKNLSPSDPISFGGFYKMRIGDCIHDMLTDIIIKTATLENIETEVEIKIQPPRLSYEIRGRLDMIFDYEGEKIGAEIKTSYGRGIVEIMKTGRPKEEHVAQCICYMEMTGINKFILLYLGRDNAYRTQFLVHKHNDKYYCNGLELKITFNRILDKLYYIEKHLNDDTIPDREYNVCIRNFEIVQKYIEKGMNYNTSWQCSYCKYKSYCWQTKTSMSGKHYHQGEKFPIDVYY